MNIDIYNNKAAMSQELMNALQGCLNPNTVHSAEQQLAQLG